jgi:hypothetical protein
MAKPAQIKTKVNEASVGDFLKGLKNEQQRKDSEVVLKLMKKASGLEPKLWGTAIIGFGIKRYKSPASGREVDWFLIAFSPRKANISLHLVLDLKQQSTLLKTLGKFKAGVGCLYINKLEDVDLKVLEKLIKAALKGK